MNDEIRKVIQESVERTIETTLIRLGIDVDDPISTQEQMSTIRELSRYMHDSEYQADQLHLRRWRKAMDTASTMTYRVVIGIIVTGLLGALWIGFKNIIKGV